jgi:hypothetical protein
VAPFRSIRGRWPRAAVAQTVFPHFEVGIDFKIWNATFFVRQFSLVLFVLLLFLIAKGFTITRARISLCSSLKIILFVSAYFILRLLMLGWEIIVIIIKIQLFMLFIMLMENCFQIFDPAQVTYMSESLPAYFICALNILGWLWFMRSSWVCFFGDFYVNVNNWL